MNTTFLSLGSNIEDKPSHIEHAQELLAKIGTVLKTSSLWETLPWGNSNQQKFLNSVFKMQTDYPATDFLDHIHHIEHQLGRIRKEKWGARVIDIDIILWNQDTVSSKTPQGAPLQIPHIYAHQRAFVLAPLLEIEPHICFPNNITAQHYWNILSKQEQDSASRFKKQ